MLYFLCVTCHFPLRAIIKQPLSIILHCARTDCRNCQGIFKTYDPQPSQHTGANSVIESVLILTVDMIDHPPFPVLTREY